MDIQVDFATNTIFAIFTNGKKITLNFIGMTLSEIKNKYMRV